VESDEGDIEVKGRQSVYRVDIGLTGGDRDSLVTGEPSLFSCDRLDSGYRQTLVPDPEKTLVLIPERCY